MASSDLSKSSRKAKSATESYLKLLREQQHCDVTFLVGPARGRIQCHQVFLKARSPVFATMFSSKWNEGSREIEIPDVDPKTFYTFLMVRQEEHDSATPVLYNDEIFSYNCSSFTLIYSGHPHPKL